MVTIEAVVDIAYHSNGQPVQSQQITRRQNIPGRYLEHTLQKLVKAKILTGVRGPRGGYQLAKERRRISIGEIVRIVADLESENSSDNTHINSEMYEKVLNPMWGDLKDSIVNQLNTITIEDLCLRADSSGVQSEGRKNLHYSIK